MNKKILSVLSLVAILGGGIFVVRTISETEYQSDILSEESQVSPENTAMNMVSSDEVQDENTSTEDLYPELNSYSISYLAEFELMYFPGWEFDHSTVSANFYDTDIPAQRSTITKGGTTITMIISPAGGGECQLEGVHNHVLLNGNINGSEYSRFDDVFAETDFYYNNDSYNKPCSPQIPLESVYIEKDIIPNTTSNEPVDVYLTLEVEGYEFIDEADIMISQSTLK